MLWVRIGFKHMTVLPRRIRIQPTKINADTDTLPGLGCALVFASEAKISKKGMISLVSHRSENNLVEAKRKIGSQKKRRK
jgi:hypothetical protein